jgi:5-methylthioribose kinase
MVFLLNTQNVFDYLIERHLCQPSDPSNSTVEPIAAKNFNLLVKLPDGRKLLVKQERHNEVGQAAGEFVGEWQLQAFLAQFPAVSHLRLYLPEVLHFDAANSLMVFSYLEEYQDLMEFHTQEKQFPTDIAAEMGTILGQIHRGTELQPDYQAFFTQESERSQIGQVPQLIQELERVGPDIFGAVPADGLKFFALYQRYDSLGQAIAELGQAYRPSCLTHNDLKLNNILLHKNRSESSQMLRLIDWERSAWGDPSFDLGTLVGSYVQLWLSSLVISQSLSIEESLRLAMTPLEEVQPSIAALSLAYSNTFPKILSDRPDFWQRVVQFTGFSLIQQILGMIQYQKSFGNTGIAMLQVAKTLLCRPEASMPTIFGTAAPQLTAAGRSL